MKRAAVGCRIAFAWRKAFGISALGSVRGADRRRTGGFTLLEIIVVVLIIGILFAIIAPGWNGFLAAQRLSAAQDEIYLVLRDAQSIAKQNRIEWWVSFRESNGRVQWARTPASTTPAESEWKSLDRAVQLDTETSRRSNGALFRAEFSHEGRVSGGLGRITLRTSLFARRQRCVMVSTLLGAIRKGEDHPSPRNGKYCY